MSLTLRTDPIRLRVDEAGTVRVGDSRVTLDTVIQRFHQGDSPETLAQSFAPLPLADIYTVIGYYLRHQTEVDAYLRIQEREADAFRAQHSQFFPDAAAVHQRLQARPDKGSPEVVREGLRFLQDQEAQQQLHELRQTLGIGLDEIRQGKARPVSAQAILDRLDQEEAQANGSA